MTQIFEDIRIIDLTQGMAGPLATMIFADYGAEVIRLEPPGGDPRWELPAYMVWNRGKKSVALDWSCADGRKRISVGTLGTWTNESGSSKSVSTFASRTATKQ